MAATGEKGFFEEWPDWAKPVMALAAMILLGGAWIGVPSLMAWELMQRSLDLGKATYEPIITVLVAMTTATIAGVFLFMTFRIDRGTRLRAEKVAKKVAKEEIEKGIGGAKGKLETFVTKEAPETVDKKITAHLTEEVLQRHVEAVLMVDANVQMVGKYARRPAAGLDLATLEHVAKHLKETIKEWRRLVWAERWRRRKEAIKAFFRKFRSSA